MLLWYAKVRIILYACNRFGRFCREILKHLSENDIRVEDYRHIDMCDEYCRLVEEGNKKEYAIAVVTAKYKVSESTLRRALKRLCRPVTT